MKKREKLSGVELSTICRQLKMEAKEYQKYSYISLEIFILAICHAGSV